MDLIYLDYNCFQRGFDDHEQIRIQMEALACQEIFWRAERKQIKLVWAFIHEDENEHCPFFERKLEVKRLSRICEELPWSQDIQKKAHDIQQKTKIQSKDALHFASALHIKAGYFITCDDRLMRQAQKVGGLQVMNPTDYLRHKP